MQCYLCFLSKVKEIAHAGLKVIEDCYDVLQVDADDSDVESDEEIEPEFILEAKVICLFTIRCLLFVFNLFLLRIMLLLKKNYEKKTPGKNTSNQR